MAPSSLVEVELAGPPRSAGRRSPRGPGHGPHLGLCDNCHRGPAAMGAPGLVESGPGLVGPGRGPAAMGAPGLSESGPGLVGPVRFRA